MAVPEVYAGFGSGVSELTKDEWANKDILTGPNWFYTLTGNAGGTTEHLTSTNGKHTYKMGRGNKRTNWYCLDLVGKYHGKSPMKQFHALTFYFRNSSDPNKGAIITSTLPESFTYSIGGNYSSPIQIGGSDFANAVVQAFTSNTKGLSFNIDTSLIWQSPKRMDIVFKIPVFDDSGSGTNVNYQEAIELFSEAILPQVGEDGLYRAIPGPNIVNVLNYRATKTSGGVHQTGSQTMKNLIEKESNVYEVDPKTGKRTATVIGQNRLTDLINGERGLWDRISIQVGGLLLLDWCIIKDLKVTFPNTKAQVLHDFRARAKKYDNGELTSNKAYLNKDGKYVSLEKDTDFKAHLQPIQAELEITISTIMGITRATFRDMLYQNESVTDEVKPTSKQEDDAALQKYLESTMVSNGYEKVPFGVSRTLVDRPGVLPKVDTNGSVVSAKDAWEAKYGVGG